MRAKVTLRNAASFKSRGYHMKKGVPVDVVKASDIDYFKSQPDRFTVKLVKAEPPKKKATPKPPATETKSSVADHSDDADTGTTEGGSFTGPEGTEDGDDGEGEGEDEEPKPSTKPKSKKKKSSKKKSSKKGKK